MQSLYSNGFEQLYDDMYQTFIDYQIEFDFYHAVLKKYNKKRVLEVGCGTGHLAKLFLAANRDYVGLDLSEDMITMSKKRNPSGVFLKKDVRDYLLETQVDATLITARTTSYLLSNIDVHQALGSIHKNLNTEGILCFDFIDATRFLIDIKGGKSVTHDAKIRDRHYLRESFIIENKSTENHMFDWESTYFEIDKNSKTKITADNSTVRSFTKNEWEILLRLNVFEPLEFIDRKSYAFDTFVVVAKKIG